MQQGLTLSGCGGIVTGAGKRLNVKGFLIDLDGVLYVGDRAVEGASRTIDTLHEQGFACRFVSNTTRKSRGTIAARLSAMGFDIPEQDIFTPPLAAVAYMNHTGRHRFELLTTGDVFKDFPPPCTDADTAPRDYVIVGDAGDQFTYEHLNRAFRQIIAGAELLALERDRYWMAGDGLALSAGPFVAALEFATGTVANVMGKPSPAFFRLALEDMHLAAAEVAMVGDDILTDISGAQEFGIKGILVRTGKYRKEVVDKSGVHPSRIIGSVADLGDLI
ncbi:MAG: TIGR01458 family HAD-type hydrolase [Methanoregula sp.]